MQMNSNDKNYTKMIDKYVTGKILVTRSSMPEYEEYCEEIRDIWDTHWLTNMGPKHKKLQEDLKKYLDVEPLDFDKDSAINGGMMVTSAKPNPRREEMFADLDGMSMSGLQKKYFPSTFKLKNRIKRKIRPIMYNMGILKIYKKSMRKRQSTKGSKR